MLRSQEFFTVRQYHGLAADADGLQSVPEFIQIQRGNRGIGYDSHPLARHMRLQQFRMPEQAAADVYRITALAQPHGQCMHNLRSALMITFSECFNLVRQLQHQCMHALLTALHDDIRHLLIKRVALLIQFVQLGMGIAGL